MAVLFQAAPQQVYESSIVFDDQHTMGDTRSVHQSIPGEPWQPGNRAASKTTCTAAGAGTSTSVTAHVLFLTRKLNNSNASHGPEETSWTLRAEEWFLPWRSSYHTSLFLEADLSTGRDCRIMKGRDAHS
jgi:hypothetical protein